MSRDPKVFGRSGDDVMTMKSEKKKKTASQTKLSGTGGFSEHF